jgi:hypothetical protein
MRVRGIKRILVLRYAAIVIGFIALLVAMIYVSAAVHYHITPKVSVIAMQKGRLEGNPVVYDCVVPKSVVDGDGVYLVYSYESVVGTKYYVIRSDVAVLAEDEYRYALSGISSTRDLLVVAGFEGELIDSGEVVLLEEGK